MQTSKEIKKEYLIRIAACMAVYTFLLTSTKIIMRDYEIHNWIKIILAILTSMPVGATFLALMDYIKKSDEYIRSLMAETIINSTGLLLFITTAWGFLELYANFPHLETYWAFILFWAIIGIVGAFRKDCHETDS